MIVCCWLLTVGCWQLLLTDVNCDLLDGWATDVRSKKISSRFIFFVSQWYRLFFIVQQMPTALQDLMMMNWRGASSRRCLWNGLIRFMLQARTRMNCPLTTFTSTWTILRNLKTRSPRKVARVRGLGGESRYRSFGICASWSWSRIALVGWYDWNQESIGWLHW